MKKIDRLILKSFLSHFILTFFIILTIIVLQFLWKYIDDMIGKGLEVSILLELLFYSSMSFVPLALPLSVLLASIMTFGNFGEHNELVVLKSAGVSILRVLRPATFFILFITVAAFYFGNYVMPITNLKFATLLVDIRQQKPALDIKERVFYNGIDGYSIKVGRKGKDNKTIYDVMIYDHSKGRGDDNVLLAEKGEMYLTEDKHYMVMKLYNGRQYQEVIPKEKNQNANESIKVTFKEWQKIFDLSIYKFDRSDEGFLKDNFQMLNVFQLDDAIAKIDSKRVAVNLKLRDYFKPYLYILSDSNFYKKIANTKPVQLKSNITELSATQEALRIARSMKGYATITVREKDVRTYEITKHRNEWHRKFTLSVSCLILFFIGGPLGAIIRRGGLGMPILFSVGFFVIFHVFSMIGEKLSDDHTLSSFTGMWLASFILTPISILLTYQVVTDKAVLSLDWYKSLLLKFKNRFSNEK